jgi:hypothetical protein
LGNIKGTTVKIVEMGPNGTVLKKEKEGIMKHKTLLVWIFFCVAFTFVAAIFISAVGVSFVYLYNTPKKRNLFIILL